MIKKKKKTYQLINEVIKINAITIRDANVPLLVNKFSKEFAKCKIASLINFFSEYNQVELDKRCKDIIAIITSQELIKQIILL